MKEKFDDGWNAMEGIFDIGFIKKSLASQGIINDELLALLIDLSSSLLAKERQCLLTPFWAAAPVGDEVL